MKSIFALTSPFYKPPLVSPTDGERSLATILEIPVDELPAVRLGPRYHYRPFAIAKRDGRERRILAPSPALKELQRRLLRNYLEGLPAHPAATAFTPGASIVTNAQRHAGQASIATLDLEDFFESTAAFRVRSFFHKTGWRDAALNTLMRLCVYRNGLPQGAPTSPILSNLVNWDMDAALTQLAHRSGAVYTRYGDDITFSWRTDAIPAYFESAVRQCVYNAGYQIQPRKDWQVYRAEQEPRITGLILGRDGRIRVPAHIHWQIFKLRWLAWWTQDKTTLARLQGYEGFVEMLS
jgi:hypothetical protein